MEFEFDPIPESMELIPGAESIPQCSTSLNRMTALSLTVFYLAEWLYMYSFNEDRFGRLRVHLKD